MGRTRDCSFFVIDIFAFVGCLQKNNLKNLRPRPNREAYLILAGSQALELKESKLWGA